MSATAGSCVIRPGRLSDLSDVVRIERASFADPWSELALAGELVEDILRLPLIAEVEGRIAGYVMAWKVADQLHILNIAVDPELRRAGIATRMLLACAREALILGLRELTLEVRRSNTPALRFYELHGFIEVGVREGYYADNGEDALIMNCPVGRLLPN